MEEAEPPSEGQGREAVPQENGQVQCPCLSLSACVLCGGIWYPGCAQIGAIVKAGRARWAGLPVCAAHTCISERVAAGVSTYAAATPPLWLLDFHRGHCGVKVPRTHVEIHCISTCNHGGVYRPRLEGHRMLPQGQERGHPSQMPLQGHTRRAMRCRRARRARRQAQKPRTLSRACQRSDPAQRRSRRRRLPRKPTPPHQLSVGCVRRCHLRGECRVSVQGS